MSGFVEDSRGLYHYCIIHVVCGEMCLRLITVFVTSRAGVESPSLS